MSACEWCGGDADPLSVCPRSIGCATCHAKPGAHCKRPSGHKAAQLHAGRIHQAESLTATAQPAHQAVRLDLGQ